MDSDDDNKSTGSSSASESSEECPFAGLPHRDSFPRDPAHMARLAKLIEERTGYPWYARTLDLYGMLLGDETMLATLNQAFHLAEYLKMPEPDDNYEYTLAVTEQWLLPAIASGNELVLKGTLIFVMHCVHGCDYMHWLYVLMRHDLMHWFVRIAPPDVDLGDKDDIVELLEYCILKDYHEAFFWVVNQSKHKSILQEDDGTLVRRLQELAKEHQRDDYVTLMRGGANNVER